MALSTKEANIIDNSNPSMQKTALGTELKAVQAGQNITLPTSDPGVAGQLWANSAIVTVSAG